MRVTVYGRTFHFADRYKRGHTCTGAEAAALNKLVAKHTRDAFYHKQQLSGLEVEHQYRLIGGWMEDFDFGEEKAVREEARVIAREKATKYAKVMGGNPSKQGITAEANRLLNDPRQGPTILRQARARICRIQQMNH